MLQSATVNTHKKMNACFPTRYPVPGRYHTFLTFNPFAFGLYILKFLLNRINLNKKYTKQPTYLL